MGASADRYRLLKRIGSGGMAEVLEAVAVGEQGFERRVAIKRMLAITRDGIAGPRERMFLDEARIAAQLHHANIVAVLDYGIADGAPFQVLDYVDGVDVNGLLAHAEARKLAFPIELALYIGIMIGHALEYAHAMCDANGKPLGIVHRDVTPGNILVSWSGDVKLTDFGIAFAHRRMEKTLDGSTKGTPSFMAPEQSLAGEIDRRTDLFSLGCVLHAMIAGWSPLGEDGQLMHLASGGELTLDAKLPSDVRAIIARLTRYARNDRYDDAREVVAALAMALAARTMADPRTALCEWMRELKGATPPTAKRGKLDAFLDGEIVLAKAETAGRSFTAIHETRPEQPLVAKAPASRPRLWWMLAIAGVAFVITFAIVGRMRTDHTVATAPANAPGDTHEIGETPIERWTALHRPAAHDLAAWAKANPEASARLFVWDDAHPSGMALMVTWVIGNPGKPMDGFFTIHPEWHELAAIFREQHAGCDAFLAWIRSHELAATSLTRRQRPLSRFGRHLDDNL